MTTEEKPSRRRTIVMAVCAVVLFSVGAFVLVEGVASAILFGIGLAHTERPFSRPHTQYDPELGWVTAPNVRVQNVMGQHFDVKLNAQGFRDESDDAPSVTPAKRRILCAGDSFTFGHGVGDDEPWCRLLAKQDPRLQTINLGVDGYGLDQIYLRSRRESARFEHSLLVVGFIQEDLDRLGKTSFFRLSKPTVMVENGVLKTVNVPVPNTLKVRWLEFNSYVFRDLRVSQLFRGARPEDALANVDLSAFGDFQSDVLKSERELFDSVFAMFEELQKFERARGSRLLVVYLPAYFDLSADEVSRRLRRQYLGQELVRRGIAYLDLTEEMMRSGTREQLFLDDIPEYRRWSHYNPEGHRRVAALLRDQIHP